MLQRALRGRKRGFSLIAVMIIGLAGMSIAGIMFQLMTSGSGASNTAITSGNRYNLLTEAVEKKRSKLIEVVDVQDSSDPDTKPPKRTPGNVNALDDLLIVAHPKVEPIRETSLTAKQLAEYGLKGGSGKLSVRVYDMQYTSSEMLITDEKQKKLLPPSVVLDTGGSPGSPGTPVDYAGAYLIRATLTVGDDHAGSVAMALILSNNEPGGP
jgi:hypothetical protein